MYKQKQSNEKTYPLCFQNYVSKECTNMQEEQLIHAIKRRKDKDNQLQSLELSCRISYWKNTFNITESDGNMVNSIF